MARENMTAIARPRPERGQARRRSQLLLPAFALVLGVAGTTAGAGAPGRTRPTAPASSAYRAAPMTGSSRDTGSRDTGSRDTGSRDTGSRDTGSRGTSTACTRLTASALPPARGRARL
jgi:hypothetical protein